ncbi:MAG: hypothetical protein HUJ31_16625, partial [Pseudomonadales bacterium]|nr:hypothetical protein [Pseudomonadales bacterium]
VEGLLADDSLRYVQLAPHTFRPRIYPPQGYSVDDFNPNSLIHDYLGGQGIRFGTAPAPAPIASTNLFSQAQLPSGAEITGMLCYVKDDDATQDMLSESTARLLRINPLDGADDATLTNVSIGTQGLSGPLVFAATVAAGLEQVDNKHFHYTVAITIAMNTEDDDYFDPMFRGCRIAYRP